MTGGRRLLVVVSFGPVESASNGYFIRMLNLLEALAGLYDGVVVLEYTEGGCGDKCYQPRRLGGNVVSIPLPGNQRGSRLHYLRLAAWQVVNTIRLRRLLRRADTVLIGSPLFAPTMLLTRLLGAGAPMVLEPHMLFAERAERKGLRGAARLLRVLEGLVYRLADAVVALSPEMERKLREGYRVARVVAIPFRLPRGMGGTADCGATGGERRGECSVFFIGSLEAPQNLEAALYLVAAVAAASKATGRKIRLVIVGKAPPHAARIVEEAAARTAAEVELLGYVEDPDPYACSADVLAAPMFTMSGVSTKMLYYLRFPGKRIIASSEALEGLRHLAKRHGNVAEARSPRDFAKLLAEECMRLGPAGEEAPRRH